MDFYNIAFTSIITILIIIILEGLLYFVALGIIFNNITNNIINNMTPLINNIYNNNYTNLIETININPNNITPSFISSIIKLYLIGTFSDQIIDEHNYITNNDIDSYIAYSFLIAGPFVLFLILKFINHLAFHNKLKIAWKTVIYNISLTMLILMTFILPVIFTVFVYLQDNVNTNDLQSNILKIILKYFN